MTPSSPAQISGRTLTALLAIGIAGVLITLLLGWRAPDRALQSWLFGFMLLATVPVGALLMLTTFHAAEAAWVSPLRRTLEWVSWGVVALPVLFLPIALGRTAIYRWAQPGYGPPSSKTLFEFRHIYLGQGFWLGRAALYLVSWALLAGLLEAWSRAHDAQPTPAGLRRQRVLGAIGLPWFIFSATFATYDWMMSLDPDWSSEIYGLIYLAGAYMAANALAILICLGMTRSGHLRGLVGEAELHNLSKLLFTAVCFWAYVGYAQYMLIWIANEPEELSWVLLRTTGPWGVVFYLLIALHFAVPFFALLGRSPKVNPAFMTGVCVFLLLIHVLDLCWELLPSTTGGGVVWTDLTASVGVGGLLAAAVCWRLRGSAVVCRGDPQVARKLASLGVDHPQLAGAP